MRSFVLLLAVCLAAANGTVRAAEIVKIELMVLKTVTVTEEQFLVGSQDGRPIALAVELRLPTAGTSRLPAVVLLHGSGGILASNDRWARELNEFGIATLLVDSFTERGIGNTVGDQGQLSELAMVIDAYRALDLLAKHPRIDPTRIGLLGNSRGGVATMYAPLKRFQRMYASADTQFAFYLSFYPPCARTYLDDMDLVDRPLRLFHGTADDIAPVTQCRSYVKRLQSAGQNAQLIEYPGAYHGFDNPLNPVRLPGPQTTRRGCDLYEQSVGRVVNRETGLPLTRSDECLKGAGPTGYDERARLSAVDDVKRLLRSLFELDPAP